MKAGILNTSNMIVYYFGSDVDVTDFLNFTMLESERGNPTIAGAINRITDKSVYMFVKATKLSGKAMSIEFNKRLEVIGRLVTEDDWYEAALIADTEGMKRALDLPEDLIQETLMKSKWRFL